MDIDYLGDKKVAVLGLGMEGVALAQFLVGKVNKITLLDRLSKEKLLGRAGEEQNPELAKILSDETSYDFLLGDDHMDSLADFDIVFRTPGIPYLNSKIQQAKDLGVEISSQIKLFFDLCPARIIGVTGTKGKGTTASLIYEILKKQSGTQHPQNRFTEGTQKNSNNTAVKQYDSVFLAGNIGKPAITLLDKIKSDDIVILELSSFQLQDMEKSPHIAVITNLSVDHLDYHKDKEEYRNAKKSIFKYQSENDFLIVNSKIDKSYYQESKTKQVVFSGLGENRGQARVIEGEGNGCEVYIDIDNKQERVVSSDEIKLVGEHNMENIAVASIVANIIGVEIDDIREAAKNFEGLPHRLELVAEIEGVKYYNDSFATNPESTMAAINAFTDNKILILGGSSKGADFSELASKISSNNITAVILIGDESSNIEESLNSKKFPGKIEKTRDLQQAIDIISKLAKSGDVVIFSPACASFDMFKNYKDRGRKFKNAVFELAKSEKPCLPVGRRKAKND